LGYSMPDDLMSGSGVRIGYSIMESIPFVGSYLVFFVFGGPYPRESVFIPRFFIVHVLIIPLLIIGLLGAHLMLVMRQKHTQWPGKHRTYRNVVGHPLWPNFAAKSAGLMLMVAGVLGLMGAFFQIDPIWQFGPYAASHASDAAQPDWYMLWLEGALRLMPNWEISGLGHTFVAVVFIPAVLMPALTFLGMYLLPAVERRLVPGQRPLQLLIPPRRRPVHTAVGVGAATFYGLLTVAGTDDVLANFFHISLPDLVMTLQIALVVLPFVAGTVAWLLCHDLERTTVPRVTRQPAVVVPSPRGGYELKVEEPTASLEDPEPIPVPASLLPSPVKDPPGSRADGQGDLDEEVADAGHLDGDGRARHRSAERQDQAQER
jgi:ubiquinol-cytochrome c reductase cytochrome b subunit